MKKRLTKKLKEQIIKLYHQGKSVSQISDILHIAEAEVMGGWCKAWSKRRKANEQI